MPLFTRANARMMAAQSAAVRRAHREQRERAPQVPPAEHGKVVLQSEDYAHIRLSRVRGILDTLDTRLARLASNGDPKQVRDLAAALAPLSDQECWLSQRPKPGMLRPSSRPERWRRVFPTLPEGWVSETAYSPAEAEQTTPPNDEEQPIAEEPLRAEEPPLAPPQLVAPPPASDPRTVIQFQGLPPGTRIDADGKLRRVGG